MGDEDLDVSALLSVRFVNYFPFTDRLSAYHYGDVFEFVCVCILRYLPGYPYKCPKLIITPEKGLLKADGDRLLSLLHDQVGAAY